MGRLLGLATFARRRREAAEAPSAPRFAELAESYRSQDLLQEAKAVCEQGLAIWPSYVSGHIVMARVYRDAGALHRAEASAKRALQLDPMNAVAHTLMGDIALRRGRWEQAVRHLEDALFFSPSDAHAIALLAMAQQRERPIVVSPPTPALKEPPPAPAPPPVLQPPGAQRAPQTDTEREIGALRQVPGIEGALLLTGDGLPVSGTLGSGNDVDEETAALAAGVVAEWARSDQLPPARSRALAVVEAEGGQLVLATADRWILLVAVSGHMRLGRVLGSIRSAVEQISASRT
jgi:predicted regulator of Ras-like GTPase activity (Roadblock/LC7/MglB family)